MQGCFWAWRVSDKRGESSEPWGWVSELGGMWLEFTSEWWERERLVRREYLNQMIENVGVLEKVRTGQSRQVLRKGMGWSGWFSGRCFWGMIKINKRQNSSQMETDIREGPLLCLLPYYAAMILAQFPFNHPRLFFFCPVLVMFLELSHNNMKASTQSQCIQPRHYLIFNYSI